MQPPLAQWASGKPLAAEFVVNRGTWKNRGGTSWIEYDTIFNKREYTTQLSAKQKANSIRLRKLSDKRGRKFPIKFGPVTLDKIRERCEETPSKTPCVAADRQERRERKAIQEAIGDAFEVAQDMGRPAPDPVEGASQARVVYGRSGARVIKGAAAVVVNEPTLVDSGASQHLVGRNSCTKEDLSKATAVDVSLITANGTENATQEVPLPMPALGIEPPALVLDNAPAVASLGRLVIDSGHDFHWLHRKPHHPWLVTPAGLEVVLDVREYAPYLLDPETIKAMVARDIEAATLATSDPAGNQGSAQAGR